MAVARGAASAVPVRAAVVEHDSEEEEPKLLSSSIFVHLNGRSILAETCRVGLKA